MYAVYVVAVEGAVTAADLLGIPLLQLVNVQLVVPPYWGDVTSTVCRDPGCQATESGVTFSTPSIMTLRFAGLVTNWIATADKLAWTRINEWVPFACAKGDTRLPAKAMDMPPSHSARQTTLLRRVNMQGKCAESPHLLARFT